MADDNYKLTYTGDASNFVSETTKAENSLKSLDANATKAKGNLRSLFKGVSAAAFTKGADAASQTSIKLVGSLGAVVRAIQLVGSTSSRVGPLLANLFGSMIQQANAAARAGNKAEKTLGNIATQAQAANAALLGTASSASSAASSLSMIRKPAGGVTTSLGRIAGTAIGIHLAKEAIRELADSLEQAAKFANECAEDVIKTKDAVRELRAIRGDKTTEDTSAEIIKMMEATGATKDEAIAFETMWGSAIPAATADKEKWGLNDKETGELKNEMLAYAVSHGIPAETVGKMVPLMGAISPMKTKADVHGEVAAMHKMGLEGIGKFGEMNKSQLKLMGSMVRPGGGGMFKSSGELMAAIAATSITTPVGRTPTDIKGLAGEMAFANNKEKKATFERLGIEPGKDDYLSTINKLAPLAENPLMPGESVDQRLHDAGFTSKEAKTRLKNAIGTRKVLAAKIQAAKDARDPGLVARENAAFRASDPARFGAAATEASKAARGKETAKLVEQRGFAEAGLRHDKIIDTPLGNMAEKLLYPKALANGRESGRELLEDAAIQGNILRAAPRLGKGADEDGTLRSKEELNRMIESLTPEERRAFDKMQTNFARGGRGSLPTAVGRPPGGGALPGVPAAMTGGMGSDPEMMRIQQRQLSRLDTIAAAASARSTPTGRPATPIGPLGVDSSDGGYLRA